MWQPKLEARVLQELALQQDRPRARSGHRQRLPDRAAGAPRGRGVLGGDPRRRSRRSARRNLERHGADNVMLEIGDAARGWARHAPYDVIVLTGSTPMLPQSFLDQLAAGRTPVRGGGRGAGDAARASSPAPRPGASSSVRPVRDRPRAAGERRAAPAVPLLTWNAITPGELAAWLADERREKPRAARRARAVGIQKRRASRARRLMPMREMPSRSSEIDEGKEVVAICHHGGRSMQVAMFLEKRLQRSAQSRGGIDAWSRTVDPAVPLY